jgi:hypothetical protein
MQTPITTEEVMCTITYTATLTKLAQSMLKEAEGEDMGFRECRHFLI